MILEIVWSVRNARSSKHYCNHLYELAAVRVVFHATADAAVERLISDLDAVR